MGRRKIEIRPILNERNRTVTFQKRKHGLFKKAYELGVLCSVDIAIIIVDQRPGRDQKLYEYCSDDIGKIVGRRMQHVGEIDTRTPLDYAEVTANGDMDDGDEDDVDGAVGSPVLLKSPGNKRGWEDEQYTSNSHTGDAKIDPNFDDSPPADSYRKKKPRLSIATFPDTQRDMTHPYEYNAYPPLFTQMITPTSARLNSHKSHVQSPVRPSSSNIIYTQSLRYPISFPHPHPNPNPHLHPPPPLPHTSSQHHPLTPPSFDAADLSSASAVDVPMLSNGESSFDTSTISQNGSIGTGGGGSRAMDAPDLLAALFDALAKSNDQGSSSVSGNQSNHLEWPLHSVDARGYVVSPHVNNNAMGVGANANVDRYRDREWFEYLSATSSTIGANSNTRTRNEFPHLHPKPPNRLLTPTSPLSPISGSSKTGFNPGSGTQGKDLDGGRGRGRGVRAGGETGILQGSSAHSRRVGRTSGYVHIKEEDMVA